VEGGSRVSDMPNGSGVLRGYNDNANTLATMGTELSDVESVIYQEDVAFATVEHVRGFWDGGYDPGSEYVGVGWYLEYRKSNPAPGALWTRLLTGCRS